MNYDAVMRTYAALLLLLSAPPQQALYKNDAFTVTDNGVRQGRFEAVAKSRTEITSTYDSLYDSILQLQFSINGTLDDIAKYDENRIFFSSKYDKVVSPVYVFGRRESHELIGEGQGQNRDGKVAVTIRLDMRPVLRAFERQGYYEFYNMKRVTPREFKGVHVTGDKPPLASKPMLTDPDKDGIYEVTLEVDAKSVANTERARPGTWRLQRDISAFPRYESPQLLVDALYAMSLEEVLLDVRPDGAFMAGKLWDGVWTRDISHAIILSLAILAPDVARTSLMRKVTPDGRIIQDTGTGGSWPVSTDRVTWGLAAWEVYAVTGDREWLNTAYDILARSAAADLKVARASNNLFYGESGFMDWREQSYPRWMEPKDIYESQVLNTNVIHYQSYRTLAKMASVLGKPAKEYEEVAAATKAAINETLWMPEKGYYAMCLYGRVHPALLPKSDSLGEALAVLFDVADGDRKSQILKSTPLVAYGVPDFYPQIPNMSAYHNNAIWPFVVGYWTWASAKARHAAGVEHGLASIYRQAALFLTNKENMVATTGDDSATMLNSARQLWSVGANLATVHRVLLGMRFEHDRLVLEPFIPKAYAGTRTLKNFKYRGATLDVTVEGYGDRVESVTLDGKAIAAAVIPGDLTGKHAIVVTMADNEIPASTVAVGENAFAPETPAVRSSGPELSWDRVEGAVSYVVYRNGAEVAGAQETTYRVPEGASGEYQVLAVDGRGFQSFLSAPVEVFPDAARIAVEAEAGKPGAEKQHSGYSGEGYLKLDKAQNLAVEYEVTVPRPGTYSLELRYANGNGPVNTDNKCAVRTLRVDGRRVGALVMPQRGTEWNNWGYSNSHLVSLTAGKHTIRVAFEEGDDNMNGAVNEALLDRLELTLVGEATPAR
jgi:hypothetical protein